MYRDLMNLTTKLILRHKLLGLCGVLLLAAIALLGTVVT